MYNAGYCIHSANVISIRSIRKINEKPMFAFHKQMFHFVRLHERDQFQL